MKTKVSCNENFNIKARNIASKNPAVSALQDLLFYEVSIIGFFANKCSKMNVFDKETEEKIVNFLYLTNKGINFSIPCMMREVKNAEKLLKKLENLYIEECKKKKKQKVFPQIKYYNQIGNTLSEMVSLINIINSKKSIEFEKFDIFVFQELLKESLCAIVIYLKHIEKEKIFDFEIHKKIYDILDFLSDEKRSLNSAKKYVLKTGELHFIVIEKFFEMLKKNYGEVTQTKVNISRKKGHAILVVGDDFKFLKEILEKTKDKDINIYTYGNLNYAHAFSEFKKYKNLKGIYFGKYTNITGNIEAFHGAVILSSGNIENIDDIFRGRIFSTEEISILGVGNIKTDNIQPLLNAAFDSQGYLKDEEDEFITIGFEKKDIKKIFEKIFLKLSNKELKKITLLLGCNNKNEKNIKKQEVIISLGCFENEYFINNQNKKNQELNKIINLGPFSNIYIVIKMIFYLSGKLKKDFSKMPLEIIINLQNSSSVAILFTLLSFGIKNIKINSEFPVYLTNSILRNFGEKYNLYKTEKEKNTEKQNFL